MAHPVVKKGGEGGGGDKGERREETKGIEGRNERGD